MLIADGTYVIVKEAQNEGAGEMSTESEPLKDEGILNHINGLEYFLQCLLLD